MRSILLLLLLLAGCASMRPDRDRPAPPLDFDLQGHRGARGLLPENTIPGFLRALALGVTTLEMDAVIAADGEVVLSHEPWFSHTICSLPSGEPIPEDEEQRYRIYEMPYVQVAQFDCGRRGHPGFPRQRAMPAAKPRLRDVIAAAEAYAEEQGLPPVRYNIETKSKPEWDGVLHPTPEVFTRALYDVITDTGIRDRATIQSFDPRTLRVARRLDPGLSLALLIEGFDADGLEANVEDLGFTPAIYSPHYQLVDDEMIEAAHARGMLVIPWTINTLEEMRALRDLGVDGLITDYPDLGARLLAEPRPGHP